MYLISVKLNWMMLNFRCKWPTCCIQQRLLLKKQLSAGSWFVSNDRKNERPKRLMISVLHRPMIPHLNVFLATVVLCHTVVDILKTSMSYVCSTWRKTFALVGGLKRMTSFSLTIPSDSTKHQWEMMCENSDLWWILFQIAGNILCTSLTDSSVMVAEHRQ